MMRKSIVAAVAASLLLSATTYARDAIDNGNLLVKPGKNNTFATGGYIMGKAELFGYIGDLKESKKITGIVLQNADRASPEQKHLLVITAHAQHVDVLEDDDGKLAPLVDPTVPAPSAPTPAQ